MGNKAMAGRLAPLAFSTSSSCGFPKTLLPRVIELLREADNPKFDQKSAVNGYGGRCLRLRKRCAMDGGI